MDVGPVHGPRGACADLGTGGGGAGEEVALGVGNADLAQGGELGGCFDAFTDQGDLAFVGEVPHAVHERAAARVGVDAVDDGDVELDDLGVQLKDVPQARVPRTGVIDRQSGARAQRRKAGS